MEIPKLSDCIITHYGCPDFKIEEHSIYWIGAIYYSPTKQYFFESENELNAIENYRKFLLENKEKTIIHWSMNSPKFGFKAIENRYKILTNKTLNLPITNNIDLSEFLKEKYGVNYIERKGGRLNNLAQLNGFSGIKKNIEVINLNEATNRLELLFSIVQSELQGNLITLKSSARTPKNLLVFKDQETLDKVHNLLKGYFPNKEKELLNALKGDELSHKLLFDFSLNRFVEVFKRLKYNGYLLSTSTQIKNWICKNFIYTKTKGENKFHKDCNENTVWDTLTKTKCEPSKKNRICETDWLPYQSQSKRVRQAQIENL